jgi:alpha-mannosidase
MLHFCNLWLKTLGFGAHRFSMLESSMSRMPQGYLNGYLDARRFGRLAAQNRGVTVKVFTGFQSAEEWLLK